MKRLPNTEFEIMKAIWELEPPVSAPMVMAKMGDKKQWKIQSLISLMLRLTQRGFLRTEKIGRDRVYYPLVEKEDYLVFETEAFLEQYHGNSLISFVHSLYAGNELSEEDAAELKRLIEEKE
jgi:BlaI family penicillinase repressor